MKAYYCPKCGKEFYPTAYHTFKKNGVYYCGWTCFKVATTKPKRKFVMPNIGDTIQIKRMRHIPNYSGRVGVVKSIDFLGQLHGTWGGLVVVPGDDIFEIIGEQNE